MDKFNFITDEDFRSNLESDFQELGATFSCEAWKAVHVLAGSIIEALLIDYLLSIKHKGWPEKKILGLQFVDIITECHEIKLLSEQTKALTTVIKNYRNLVHPGRLIRLEQSVDKNSAQVAVALLEMIIEDVKRTRQALYGFTAEQLISKLENDLKAINVIEHFIKDMQEKELERVLLTVLPERYFDILYKPTRDNPIERLKVLSSCYHYVFNSVSDQIKTKIMDEYIRILKNEVSYRVEMYESNFYKNSYLKFVANESDRKFIKDRLFSLIKSQLGIDNHINKFKNIAEFLDDKEIEIFAHRVIFSYGSNDRVPDKWIWDNYKTMSELHKKIFDTILEEKSSKSSGETQTKLVELRRLLDREVCLPF